MPLSPLPVSFYQRAVQDVARDLLGARLVRRVDGGQMTGIITETEAYDGETDLACHARAGRTPRTAVMYGPAGRAYIYFIYGMHWLLNCVTGEEGFPAAVLIRAIHPMDGLDEIAKRRPNISPQRWSNGPACLTRAFAIGADLNGIDLTNVDAGLWIEPGQAVPPDAVQAGKRVGIERVPEPWRSMPWRYRIDKTRIFF